MISRWLFVLFVTKVYNMFVKHLRTDECFAWNDNVDQVKRYSIRWQVATKRGQGGGCKII